MHKLSGMPALRPALLTLAAVVALTFSACGGDDDNGEGGGSSAAASGTTVGMKDLKFGPETLQVKVGETVTWRNNESIPHNVVAEEGADFKSDTFGKDGTYTFTPKEAGTIKYECTLHPGMVGTLEVSG